MNLGSFFMSKNPKPFFEPLQSEPGWPAENHEHVYAAWVPCVTGQLSFSMIGDASGFRRANLNVNSENAKSSYRLVAVHQHRRTKDVPLPPILYEAIKGWNATDYILLAKTFSSNRHIVRGEIVDKVSDQIGVLCGSILVFPYQEDLTAESEKRRIVKEISQSLQKCEQTISESVSEKDVDRFLEEVNKSLSEVIEKKTNPFNITFSLYRTGELRIDASAVAGHQSLINSDASSRNLFIDSLVRQAYYFIKDATHRHYHHHNDADNVLPVTRSPKSDDQSWRRETLWALGRAVLSGRRSASPAAQKNAIGILAYAESFQNNIANIKRQQENFHEIKIDRIAVNYDFNHTKMSIESTHALNKWKDEAVRWAIGVLITFGIAVFAIWVSIVGVLSQEYRDQLSEFEFLTWSASNPMQFVMGSIMVVLIIMEVLKVGITTLYPKTYIFIRSLLLNLFVGLSRRLSNKSPETSDKIALAAAIIIVPLFSFLFINWASHIATANSIFNKLFDIIIMMIDFLSSISQSF